MRRSPLTVVAHLALLVIACIAIQCAAGSSPPPRFLLIVHTKELATAAQEWKAWRSSQGWSVTLAAVDGGTAEAARDRIRAWATEQGSFPRAVLLLGGVSDAESGIPTFRFKQLDPLIKDRRDDSFVSDGPYQDLNDDGTPDLMLGRVPVSTVAHATRVLDKIRAWETAPPSAAHRCVELVGGEGRFGPYDALLEVLTSTLLIDSVPPEFDLRASYAKASSPFCPPPSRVRAIIRDQALSGALLFNYVGHGHATGLDALWWRGGRERLLETQDLALTDAESPSLRPGGVALLVCCSAGWYDDRAKPSLAEALLLHPSGPVAIFAGSRPTHPYANAIVERDGVRALLRDRVDSVGAWDLAITRSLAAGGLDEIDLIATPIAMAQKWALSLRETRRQHALLYNLIGDPSTRLVYAPPTGSVELSLVSATRLSGVLHGADATLPLVAEVLLTARRTATPRGVIPATGQDDPGLELITTRNWPRANEWVRWRGEVPVKDGRFELDLPDLRTSDAENVVVIVNRLKESAAGGAMASGTTAAPSGQAVTGAQSTSAVTRGQQLVALSSRERLRLLRSWLDDQGLPSDRGAAPR